MLYFIMAFASPSRTSTHHVSWPQHQPCGGRCVFVENYPEFFDSYEREDIKDTYICDECDDIISELEGIRDSVGELNGFGKSVLSKDWNQNIDEVIKRLEKLKH
jgi:hypothetical protein